MECKRFTIEDIPQINAWNAMRFMPKIDEWFFPKIGFVVDNIAAGFIYQTDSVLCFIDGYVSNPDSNRLDRKAAFDLITNNLLIIAKEFGFKSVLAYTQHPAIKERCEKYDFNLKGRYDLYVKEI